MRLLCFLIITKKTLTPLLSQCNLQAGSLGRVEEKNFVGGAANASRKLPLSPDIAKESLLADYNQGGVRPKLDSLGVNEAHLL